MTEWRGKPGIEVPRVLGRVDGPPPGPTLVVLGGLHGNEPAGVRALLRVVDPLSERREHLRGRFVALAGNLAALRSGRRYVGRDLNRAWTGERVRALGNGAGTGAGEPEDREQRELLAAIRDAVEGAPGPVHFLDLHTTSGGGGPFATVSDTLPSRAFAMRLGVPLVLGLEELVEGTLLAHLVQRGFVSAVFESGRHDEPRAVERAEAAVWIAVAAAGLIPEDRLPELRPARELLRGDAGHLPGVLEMRYRHAVRAGDGFRMLPGFRSFQRVREGEVVARAGERDVEAPESGRILMPLYQEQGSDGFFVVREVRPFWLRVSGALRRLRLGSVVHALPGIRRHPDLEDALLVDRRVARWYAVELLHLLGFRKHLERGRDLVVVRRRFDAAASGWLDPGAGG